MYNYTMTINYGDINKIIVKEDFDADKKFKFTAQQIELLISKEISHIMLRNQLKQHDLKKTLLFKFGFGKKKIQQLEDETTVVDCPESLKDFLRYSEALNSKPFCFA